MIDHSVNLRFSACAHRNVVVDLSGGRRFIEGEVTDDILVRALCLDCGEYLTESEVRGVWQGESADSLAGGDDDIY